MDLSGSDNVNGLGVEPVDEEVAQKKREKELNTLLKDLGVTDVDHITAVL